MKYKHKSLGRIATRDDARKQRIVNTWEKHFKDIVIPHKLLENSADREEMWDLIDEAWEYFIEWNTEWINKYMKDDFRKTIEKYFLAKSKPLVQQIKQSWTKEEISPTDWTTCTVKEAMEILWTPNRRNVDMPVCLGKIKRVSEKWKRLVLDRQSVFDYKNKVWPIDHRPEKPKKHHKTYQPIYAKTPVFTEKMADKEETNHIHVEWPWIKHSIPANNPSKILGEDFDESE